MVGFPTNPWVFLLKMIILGCVLGVPPFKETPICFHNILVFGRGVIFPSRSGKRIETMGAEAGCTKQHRGISRLYPPLN